MPRLPLLAIPLLADGVYLLASKLWARHAKSETPNSALSVDVTPEL